MVEINNHFRTGLLLGSNIGNKKSQLKRALKMIEKTVGRIIGQSSIYKTEAWGNEDQPEFYNMAVLIETTLNPQQLLHEILKVESKMGRVRKKKWEDRIIDIDILFYNDEVLDLPELHIPHPQLTERKFALTPLAELEPDWIHPVTGKNINTLLTECTDKLAVHLIE